MAFVSDGAFNDLSTSKSLWFFQPFARPCVSGRGVVAPRVAKRAKNTAQQNAASRSNRIDRIEFTIRIHRKGDGHPINSKVEDAGEIVVLNTL